MPGTPATSPVFGAPRYADDDDAMFGAQVNAVTDAFDGLAVRSDDPRLSDARPAPPGGISTAQLANGAVTGQKIAAATITEANVAPDSIGSPEIINGSVGTDELADASITTVKIAAAAIGTAQLADGAITQSKLVAAIQQALFTPGDLKLSAIPAAPTGWLLCDGSPVSRTTYAALFAAIGTAFGTGDGASTFNLPDFKGRVPMGAGAGAGLTARTFAQKVGAESHSHTVAGLSIPGLAIPALAVAAHNHPLSANGAAGIQTDAAGNISFGPTGPGYNVRTSVAAGAVSSPSGSHSGTALEGTTDNAGTQTGGGTTGGGTTGAGTAAAAASNSVAPSAVVNVFIKT